MYYYSCYKEQEIEAEEGSDLPGTCGREESRNSLIDTCNYRDHVLSTLPWLALVLRAKWTPQSWGALRLLHTTESARMLGLCPHSTQTKDWRSCGLLGPESDRKHVSRC